MNVFVLGATGFIGGQIAQAALRAGWHVKCLRRDPSATGTLTNLRVEWVNGELSNRVVLRDAMSDIDVVFHAAAYYPKSQEQRTLEDQVAYAQEEIEHVIEACSDAKVKRLIYTSSLSTIGFPEPGSGRLVNESDFYQSGAIKDSAYYEAKFAMEHRVLQAVKEGFPAVILIPTAVFGPGDVHLTMGKLLIAVAKGRLIAWIPGIVNVIDVRDVAEAHIQSVELGSIGERYILGGHNITIQDALLLAANIAGKPGPRFEIPSWLIRQVLKIDEMLPRRNLTGNHLRAIQYWQGFDNLKACKKLGLSPRPFSVTIRDSLDWFKAHGYLE